MSQDATKCAREVTVDDEHLGPVQLRLLTEAQRDEVQRQVDDRAQTIFMARPPTAVSAEDADLQIRSALERREVLRFAIVAPELRKRLGIDDRHLPALAAGDGAAVRRLATAAVAR